MSQAPPDAVDVTIATFDRGPSFDPERTRSRVAIREFRGHRYVDLRIVWRDADGIVRPTRRGLSIRRGELDGVIAALQRARALLDGEQVAA